MGDYFDSVKGDDDVPTQVGTLPPAPSMSEWQDMIRAPATPAPPASLQLNVPGVPYPGTGTMSAPMMASPTTLTGEGGNFTGTMPVTLHDHMMATAPQAQAMQPPGAPPVPGSPFTPPQGIASAPMVPGAGGGSAPAPATPFALPAPTQHAETPASRGFWDQQNQNFAPMTDEQRVAGISANRALYDANAPVGRAGFDKPSVPSAVPADMDFSRLPPAQREAAKKEYDQVEGMRKFYEDNPEMASALFGKLDLRAVSHNDLRGIIDAATAERKNKQETAAQAAKDAATKFNQGVTTQKLSNSNQRLNDTELDKAAIGTEIGKTVNGATMYANGKGGFTLDKPNVAAAKAAVAAPVLRQITDDKGNKVTEQWIPETKSWGTPTKAAAQTGDAVSWINANK